MKASGLAPSRLARRDHAGQARIAALLLCILGNQASGLSADGPQRWPVWAGTFTLPMPWLRDGRATADPFLKRPEYRSPTAKQACPAAQLSRSAAGPAQPD